jgi:hypothetical protein
LSTSFSGCYLSDLSFLFLLKDLESFDFHHKIEFLLLFNPFRFKSLVLLQLFVSDSNNLGVEDHLVHLFHIIKVIVHLFLSLGEEGFILGTLIFLLFSWLDFLCSLLIHCDHSSFLCLRFGHSSLLLCLSNLLFLLNCLLSFDCRCVLDSIQIVLADDYCIVLGGFLGSLPD